VSSYGDDVTG